MEPHFKLLYLKPKQQVAHLIILSQDKLRSLITYQLLETVKI